MMPIAVSVILNISNQSLFVKALFRRSSGALQAAKLEAPRTGTTVDGPPLITATPLIVAHKTANLSILIVLKYRSKYRHHLRLMQQLDIVHFNGQTPLCPRRSMNNQML